LGSPIPGATGAAYIASPTTTTYYCYVVTDSALASVTSAALEVTVNPMLLAPTAPKVSATALDDDQPLTVSATIPSTGTAFYSWQWLVSLNGVSYSAATQCALNSGSGAIGGAGETCGIAADALEAGTTYLFKLQVTDSSSVAATVTSSASARVAVSLALTAPAVPSVGATALDFGQALSVAGKTPLTGISPYSWQWLVEVDGAGGYVAATECSVSNGTGAPSDQVEVCIVAGGSLAAGFSYTFELEVTDSASVPETMNSAASTSVVVSSVLVAPATPTTSATTLDVDQPLTITGTLPSTGTGPYFWEWLVSIDGGTYAEASQCALASGNGGSAGANETCTIAANTLTGGSTYAFELQVTDSASKPVTVTSVVSSTVTVSVTPSSPSSSPLWLYVGIALAVIVVVILASLFVLTHRRRPQPRRRPPAAPAPSVQAWDEGPSGPTVGGPAPAAPDYLETPATVPAAEAMSETAPPIAAPSTTELTPELDDLLVQLEKISLDIMKKPPPKELMSDQDEGTAQETEKSE